MSNNASSNTQRVSRTSVQLASMLLEDRHAERTSLALESERDQEVGMMADDNRSSGGGGNSSSRHKRSKKHHKSRHKRRVRDQIIMEDDEGAKPSSIPTVPTASVDSIIITQHSEGNVATVSSSSSSTPNNILQHQPSRSSFEIKVAQHDKRREEKRQRRRKEKKHSKSNIEKGKNKRITLAELKLPRGTLLDNQDETSSSTHHYYPSTNNEEEEEATGKSVATMRTTHMENTMSSALSTLSPPNPMESTPLQSELDFGSDDISVKNEVRSMFPNRAGSVQPGVDMEMGRDAVSSALADLEQGSVGGGVTGAQQQLQASSQEQVEVVQPTLFYPVEATLVESMRHLPVVYPVEATLIVSRHGSMESALESSKRKSMESMESSKCPTEHNGDDDEEGGTGVRDDDDGENAQGDKLPWFMVHKKLLCGVAGVVVLGIVAAVAGVILGSSSDGEEAKEAFTERVPVIVTTNEPTPSPTNLYDTNTFSNSCKWVDVNIVFDDYAGEISWDLLQKVSQPSDGDDSSVQEYVSSGDEEDTFVTLKTYQAPNAATTYRDGMCLEEGEYRFVITDIAGDGLCCEAGRKGYYNVTSHGETIAYGDAFGASETTSFEIQDTLCHEVEVNIAYDDYSGETSWLLERKVNEDHGHQVMFHHAKDGEKSYLKTLCLDEGSYVFTMYDDAGDGICCETAHHESQGSYNVTLDGELISRGDDFGRNESTTFKVGIISNESAASSHISSMGMD